jgi:hypothetical protein
MMKSFHLNPFANPISQCIKQMFGMGKGKLEFSDATRSSEWRKPRAQKEGNAGYCSNVKEGVKGGGTVFGMRLESLLVK